ncbi:hypothetical protein L596_019829 [Steinernema carpocapsae]|uniref:Uncharacterized protein n=1 Tax=Steinernema carpocapsae TaxID=34508 RepID=A0A4U5MRS3_STECR|nr:hypothetical protein L596_019829 [Steinernema carpocapsae]
MIRIDAVNVAYIRCAHSSGSPASGGTTTTITHAAAMQPQSRREEWILGKPRAFHFSPSPEPFASASWRCIVPKRLWDKGKRD